jgi:hypothetical protein
LGKPSAGIGSNTYRTYPVRTGESIDDIISKRNISRAEVDALNPEANLDKLQGAMNLNDCRCHALGPEQERPKYLLGMRHATVCAMETGGGGGELG